MGQPLAMLRSAHGVEDGFPALPRWLSPLLQAMDAGMAVVDGQLHISFVDASLSRMTALADGIAAFHGGLRGARSQDTLALRAAVAQACRLGRSSALRLHRPSGAPSYEVAVVAIPEVAEHALLLVRDPSEVASSLAAGLRKLYGLTRAESEVAALAARGIGMSEIARELGVGRETVRTHLKAVYRKTDTRRQSELAWLVATSVAARIELG